MILTEKVSKDANVGCTLFHRYFKNYNDLPKKWLLRKDVEWHLMFFQSTELN